MPDSDVATAAVVFSEPHREVAGAGVLLPPRVARVARSLDGQTLPLAETVCRILAVARHGEVRVVPPTDRDLFGTRADFGMITLEVGLRYCGTMIRGHRWRVIKYRPAAGEVGR